MSLVDQPILVHLAKSNCTVQVDAGAGILDSLLMAGVDVPNSCQQGICGTCETRVLAGLPDHRDHLLNDAERASNQTMLICCSRALSAELTLDL